MLTPKQVDQLRPRINQFRLVIGGLIAGVALFSLVMIAMKGVVFAGQVSTMSTIILGISFVLIVNALLIPKFVDRAMVTQIAGQLNDVEDSQYEDRALPLLAAAWLNRSIIGAAMLEGAAFMNLVGMLIEGNAIHLVVAAVTMALMVTFFPTESRIVQWIEDRLEDLKRQA